jgi:hypothetical protein
MRASEAERCMVEGASRHPHRVGGTPPPPPAAVPLPRAKTRGGGVGVNITARECYNTRRTLTRGGT